MPKYRIYWDTEYCERDKIVECDTYEDAMGLAFDLWLHEAEKNANFSAELVEDGEDE